jgi:hypothetical protein
VADEPTNRALEALINRNHADNREDILDLKTQVTRDIANLVAQLQQYVLREVYDADKRALAAREQAISDRFARIEADTEADRREAASHHRTNRTLFWTVAGGMLAAVVTVVLTTWTAQGGVH